jgi:hypothetical protein
MTLSKLLPQAPLPSASPDRTEAKAKPCRTQIIRLPNDDIFSHQTSSPSRPSLQDAGQYSTTMILEPIPVFSLDTLPRTLAIQKF